MREDKIKNKKRSEVKIFPVPFALGEIEENVKINTISVSKYSIEQTIKQAIKFHSEGKILEAEKYYQELINQGCNNHRVLSNYGVILRSLNKSKEAELSTRKAINLKPDFANAYSNLGNILRDLGRLQEAKKSLRKAIQLNPNLAETHLNLGNVLRDLNQLKKAELALLKAIELNPNFAEAHSNLGNILRNLGKLKEAKLSLLKAIELNPDFAQAHLNLGIILKDLNQLKEAELSLLKAIKISPNFAQAHSNLGTILIAQGKIIDAYKYFSYASNYAPNNIFYFINSNLRLSPIMENNIQIDSERSRFKKEINNLKNNEKMQYEDPKSFSSSIFYLAYQNRLDDREILESFAEAISKKNGMILNRFSNKKYLIASSKRKNLKIGVCSMFLRSNHSVGKCFINVLKDLARTDIDMTLYIVPEKTNTFSMKEINDSFQKIVYLPNCPQMAAKKIVSHQLDLIFYPDIGMDSFSYILALSRLALVQVNGLGHGSTSGIKNIDFYITHRGEPRESDINYTETLQRFRRLPFNFDYPKINESNITLKNVINAPNNFYIGLIQSLFKIHPSYDEILESILLKIKNAYLVLITDKTDKYKYRFKSLQDRWRKKNKLLIDRSIFLDNMGTDDFLHITRSCDIMLDPFYFGGGVTFYEAMAYGIPFITYPHNQKVNIVSAGYKQMKIKNPPIAYSPEDYINWCILYSRDKVLLESTKKEFKKQARKYLFNDNEIYKDYYEFFKEAVQNSRKKLQ